MMGARTKGQSLVEMAMSQALAIAMVVALVLGAYITAQWALAYTSTVAICELYAESPDVAGGWGGSIPYLWLPGVSVPLPEMTITVSGSLITPSHWSTNSNRVIPLTPLPSADGGRIVCRGTYTLLSRFSFLNLISPVSIQRTVEYRTVARYGWLGQELPSDPKPNWTGISLASSALLVGLVMFRRPKLALKGQTIVEYAMASMVSLPFLVLSLWAVAYIVSVLAAAIFGGATMASAAVGDNPAKTNVSFHFPNGTCDLQVSVSSDCDGKSPFSQAVPLVPTIFIMGHIGLPLTIMIGANAY